MSGGCVHFSLCFQMTAAPGDLMAFVFGQERLGVADIATTALVEGHPVVRQQFLRNLWSSKAACRTSMASSLFPERPGHRVPTAKRVPSSRRW